MRLRGTTMAGIIDHHGQDHQWHTEPVGRVACHGEGWMLIVSEADRGEVEDKPVAAAIFAVTDVVIYCFWRLVNPVNACPQTWMEI